MPLRLSKALLAIALLATLAFVQPLFADQKHQRTSKTMGTYVALTIWGDSEEQAALASKKVFDEFDRIDRLMSSWLPDSAVAKINAGSGMRAVRVDKEVFTVVQRSLEIAAVSGGAFDITVGAFRGLWKFDQDIDFTIPNESDVKARIGLVNYKDVQLNKKHGTVKLRRSGMRITLGGIAKGYALDRAVALLHAMDINDFILQAGGDLFVSGDKGGKPWTVGIRDPRGNASAAFAVADIKDRTFSTSGDYERGFVKGGVRYHHILDPVTGHPANRSRSVTVMAKDAITADVWSTALFVMGVDKGLALVEKTPDLEAVFVGADNKVTMSSGLKSIVKILHPPSPGT